MKLCILCISMVLFALPVIAETYTWEDDQGTVNFTEDLGKVPKQYRKKVKVVGEEEVPPPEANVGEGKPAFKVKTEVKTEAAREPKEKAPAVQQAVYGGKDAKTWQSEFTSSDADVKGAEKQLVEMRNRMKDTSGMSRSEYLNVQATIKSLESTVLERRKKRDDLKKDAETAGVPADLMQ
jgi:Domain of unknown function (DUF4124)